MVRTTDKLKKLSNFVGVKIMDLRVASGFSRQQIAEFLEVTHQQVQKYEKGSNRICFGRLLKLAEFFKVDIKVFYEDFQQDFKISEDEFNQQRNCLEIFKHLKKIENSEFKQSILDLVRSYVKKYNKV